MIKIELGPGQSVIIGKSRLVNGMRRCSFFVDGVSPVLRENLILREQEANTVAKRIYYVLQILYLCQGNGVDRDWLYASLEQFELALNSTESKSIICCIYNALAENAYFEALKSARELVAVESRLLKYADLACC